MKNIILLSLVIFAFLSCSKIEESDWTILIYMAADNGLDNETKIVQPEGCISEPSSDMKDLAPFGRAFVSH